MSTSDVGGRSTNAHDHTLRELRRAWTSLAEPELGDLVGDFEASYVGSTLQAVAPRALALVGLPRWFGKTFRASLEDPAVLEGVNLLRGNGAGLAATLPMSAALGPSRADRRPALVVSYPADTRRPWPWVRDELRPWADDVLLGMTFIDLPGLRRAPGTPFVLTRASEAGPGVP